VFAPGCGDIRGLYAALCGAFAGVPLFVEPRAVSSQSLRNGALDGFLTL